MWKAFKAYLLSRQTERDERLISRVRVAVDKEAWTIVEMAYWTGLTNIRCYRAITNLKLRGCVMQYRYGYRFN